jgi:hypothetical protein
MDEKKLVSLLEQVETLIKECLTMLEVPLLTRSSTVKKGTGVPKPKARSLDFEKPIRAFIKQHAKGMSGPEKFVLLLGYLAKGDTNREIASADIERQWGKMQSESLLGVSFHPSYPMRAKENDWVDSKKRGLFILRPRWQDIFD